MLTAFVLYSENSRQVAKPQTIELTAEPPSRNKKELTAEAQRRQVFFLEKCESFDQPFITNSIQKFYLKILCVLASLQYVSKKCGRS